jgi:chromosome segregation ATPase
MNDPVEIAKHTHDVAAAVDSARPLIETVSGDAFALAEQVERNNDDIGMLRQQAERVQTQDDVEPATILHSAGVDAGTIDARLRRTSGQVDEIRGDLERAGKHLVEGSKAHAKLVDELGGATPQTDELGKRLQDLSGAVEAAHKSLNAADRCIGDARGSLNSLIMTNLQADRAGAQAKIESTHTSTRAGAADLTTELKNVTKRLDGVQPQLQEATAESQALAKAAHAALNPTPKSQQVAPGSASQSQFQPHRLDNPTQERDR